MGLFVLCWVVSALFVATTLGAFGQALDEATAFWIIFIVLGPTVAIGAYVNYKDVGYAYFNGLRVSKDVHRRIYLGGTIVLVLAGTAMTIGGLVMLVLLLR